MADEIPMLSRSATHGPLPEDELAILRRIPGLGPDRDPGRGAEQGAGPGTAPGPTPDATVVLDGTTVRLGPAATAAVLDLLDRLAAGGQVSVAQQDRWLNTSQAARLAGVSNTYLRQLADRGEIPVTYRGTHRRIHPDDVQSWVRRRAEARAGEAGQDAAADAGETDDASQD
ncbi:helix-turn-helix domain-containing protein [Citricoccus sp.]|uniref:helix-turn-helix domain-containing protein n=1 Tax=Citricoccus sp. TaxID=1978372 RepID=UPI00261C27B3|nr:helix-turn-helix domain-containing protein [Citricoccus sp.]HRO29846.1 helix-turn-helix domain-containing protein [Citricoccus sp.]HRO93748.1 helix-turn-helix domain-containing protein [Citricoccus sp.]